MARLQRFVGGGLDGPLRSLLVDGAGEARARTVTTSSIVIAPANGGWHG
jgi:hypothetical protein